MTSSAPPAEGRLIARNTLLNLFGFGAPMVVALLAVPVLIGGLGTEEFGVLAIAWILLAYLGELGFGSTTTKFTAAAIGAGADGRLAAITWTTAAMQGVLGLVQCLALFLATPWLVESVFNVRPELWSDMRLCLYLLAAALPVIGISRSFQGVIEAGQRFDLITSVRIPATTANYVLPMVAVLLGWSLPAVFALVLASRVVVLLAYAALAVRAFPSIEWRPRLDVEQWRAMLGFGGWVTVSSLVSPLIVYLDRLMVGALLSMTAVTLYAAPYELVVRLAIIPMSVVATLYPAVSQLGSAGRHEQVGTLAARSLKAILLVMAPAALLLMGAASEGLRLWLGSEFARDSALALQILGAGVLVNAAAQVPYAVLQGSGRPDLPARFHLLELPLHAVVTWLLVSRWGIPGAALAWTARVTVDAFLLFAAAHRLSLLRFEVLRDERVLRISGVVLIAAAVVVTPGAVWIPALRVAFVSAVALVAVAAGWRFGLEPAERARIRGFLRPAGAA